MSGVHPASKTQQIYGLRRASVLSNLIFVVSWKRLPKCSYLVDFFLGGFERVDNAVQLDATGEQPLLQLGLLVLQQAQVHLGAAELVFLTADVCLFRADLALQGWNLESRIKSRELFACTIKAWSCAFFSVTFSLDHLKRLHFLRFSVKKCS